MAKATKSKRGKPLGNHKVGYMRPPEHTQFKPGQSGNPAGRPRKELKRDEILARVFNQKVTVREGDKSRKVSGLEAGYLAQMKKAIQGNTNSLKMLTDHGIELGVFKNLAANTPDHATDVERIADLEEFRQGLSESSCGEGGEEPRIHQC